MTGWCANCGKLVEFIENHCPFCQRSPGEGAPNRFFASGTGSHGRLSVELPMGLILLERYEVLQQLGSGRTGVVYKMFDLLRSRPVAVKVTPFRTDSGQASASRMVHEMHLFDRVHDHRHVLKVFDLHVAPWGGGNVVLLSMEYADGGDLRTWMELDQKDLTARRQQGLLYIKQLAAGAAELARAGIIPLDIKPENVVLIGGVLKVADLDSSLLHGVHPAITGNEGSVLPRMLGTHGYMSPEQLSANCLDEVDIRASLYAIGVILHELLDPQGCLPSGTRTSAPESVRARQAKPVLPQMDESLVAILRRCLAPRREERFGSPAELLDALLALDGAWSAPDSPSAESASHEFATSVPAGDWDNVQRAVTEKRYADAQRLCRRILTLVPHHEESVDVLRSLEERYAAAQAIYTTITREINSMPLDAQAMLLREAVATYPDHPEGLVSQQLLSEKAKNYSRNASQGLEAMRAGNWQEALQYLSQAAQMNSQDPRLSMLIQDLRELVDAQKEGRRSIDAAIVAGNFEVAYRLAAVLDHTIEEREAGIFRQIPGDEL